MFLGNILGEGLVNCSHSLESLEVDLCVTSLEIDGILFSASLIKIQYSFKMDYVSKQMATLNTCGSINNNISRQCQEQRHASHKVLCRASFIHT